MNNAIVLMEKKLNKYFGDEIKNITKKDADAFFLEITENSTYTTARGYVSILNHILKNNGVGFNLTINDYEIKEKNQPKGIYSKVEVEMAVENLLNPIDKFMVMAIFNGINGNGYLELLNLKKSNVDLKNSIIQVSDKTIHMDEVFKKITMDALNQKEYAYLTSDGDIKYYELNLDSEYIIKSKPMKRNKNGLEPLGVEGFKTRFKNLVASIGLQTTTGTLEKSGYIEKMHSIKTDWKVEEVRELTRTEKMNVEGYNLLRLYKNFYEI